MLARFVVNSHVKHHPNAVNSEENDDEDMEEVRVMTLVEQELTKPCLEGH